MAGKRKTKSPARRRRTPRSAPAKELTADETQDVADSVLRAKKRARQRELRGL